MGIAQPKKHILIRSTKAAKNMGDIGIVAHNLDRSSGAGQGDFLIVLRQALRRQKVDQDRPQNPKQNRAGCQA